MPKEVIKKNEKKPSISTKKIAKKDFSLSDYKKGKQDKPVSEKPQEWIKINEAFQQALNLPGFPCNKITIIRGHSDTNKTTLLIDGIKNAQNMGILPVIIITEMKWSWDHAKQLGMNLDVGVNEETGEETIDGFFLYKDRTELETIEDLAFYINTIIDDQESGALQHDVCFFIDSFGSLQCKKSKESKNNNNQWNAGAMSTEFGNVINQRINLTRSKNVSYNTSMVAINKVWVDVPMLGVGVPKMKNKGGDTMFYDASLIITCGNVANSGASKLKATRGGRQFTWGTRAKISVDKNHINGISTSAHLIGTAHGFILDEKKYVDQYKKDYNEYFENVLADGDGKIIFEEEQVDEIIDQLTNSIEE